VSSQQNSVKGPTRLRYLQFGSVILFGACLGLKHFVLDTVFVVERWIDHNRYNFKEVLQSRVSEVYFDVGIAPWYPESVSSSKSNPTCKSSLNNTSYRLYFGANFNSQVHGMFSFFPCLPYKKNTRGFPRPIIEIPNIITNNLRQGKRLNPQQYRSRLIL
jgi:hypothetical protein